MSERQNILPPPRTHVSPEKHLAFLESINLPLLTTFSKIQPRSHIKSSAIENKAKSLSLSPLNDSFPKRSSSTIRSSTLESAQVPSFQNFQYSSETLINSETDKQTTTFKCKRSRPAPRPSPKLDLSLIENISLSPFKGNQPSPLQNDAKNTKINLDELVNPVNNQLITDIQIPNNPSPSCSFHEGNGDDSLTAKNNEEEIAIQKSLQKTLTDLHERFLENVTSENPIQEKIQISPQGTQSTTQKENANRLEHHNDQLHRNRPFSKEKSENSPSKDNENKLSHSLPSFPSKAKAPLTDSSQPILPSVVEKRRYSFNSAAFSKRDPAKHYSFTTLADLKTSNSEAKRPQPRQTPRLSIDLSVSKQRTNEQTNFSKRAQFPFESLNSNIVKQNAKLETKLESLLKYEEVNFDLNLNTERLEDLLGSSKSLEINPQNNVSIDPEKDELSDKNVKKSRRVTGFEFEDSSFDIPLPQKAPDTMKISFFEELPTPSNESGTTFSLLDLSFTNVPPFKLKTRQEMQNKEENKRSSSRRKPRELLKIEKQCEKLFKFFDEILVKSKRRDEEIYMLAEEWQNQKEELNSKYEQRSVPMPPKTEIRDFEPDMLTKLVFPRFD